MSNSYKDEVASPVKEQKPKKVKRHFNKRVRQKTKKLLNDFVNGENEEDFLVEELYYDEEMDDYL